MPSDKGGLDAYMSVEAALVIPSAIFGIVLIIYMSFMVHGRCLLSQDVYLLGFRAAIYYEEQGYSNAGEYIADHADEQVGRRYFGSSKPKIDGSQSGKKISVKGSVSTNHNALYGFFKGMPDVWKSEAAAGVKIQSPSKTIRKIKRIKDLAEDMAKKKD